MAPFRDKVRGFLEQSSKNLIFTETRPVEADATTEWFRQTPPGTKRFAVRCPDPQSVRARWEKYAGVSTPASPEAIELFMDEAFPFAQLYAFTSSGTGLTDWLEECEMAELASRAQAIAVDAFDGSDVLFWRRE